MRDLIRFFRAVPPVPSLMVGTFAIVTVVSVVAVMVDASFAAGTLKAVLALQLFSASSGFMTHARRGHYDLLLTRGDDRVAIALVQWAVAVAPGVTSYLAIAAAEALATSGRIVTGLTSGSIAAVAVVSTAPWAFTVPLPRFAAAIGWLAAFSLGAAVSRAFAIPSAVVNLVFPLAMVGHQLHLDTLWPALGIALISMCAALFWIRRVSIPLEAAQ